MSLSYLLNVPSAKKSLDKQADKAISECQPDLIKFRNDVPQVEVTHKVCQKAKTILSPVVYKEFRWGLMIGEV
jgi:hypothetical protein